MGELIPFNKAAGRSALQTGGGGGTFDGMEPRVKALEVRADLSDQRLGRIEGKLDELIGKVATMEGEVRRLPGYPGLITILGVLVAVVAALIKFLPTGATP